MNKKYKITGFARLLIFMIFFAPLAYLGASYYNGEDGIAKVRSLFDQSSGETIEAQIDHKNSEIKQLEKKIESLQRDVKRLEATAN